MAKAVRYHKQGGPEVLQLDEVQVGEPGPGQVRVRHTAIGVNFVDTYQRSGLYPMQLPQVAGNEGAGVVEAVGADEHPALALVQVRVGAALLLARLTRRSADQLGVVPGQRLWVQVKSVALLETR